MKKKVKCATCKGTGRVRFRWNDLFYSWATTWTEPRYRDEWCKRCKGKGVLKNGK